MKEDGPEVSITRLIYMCEKEKNSVTIAKRSALERASKEFGLMTNNAIKDFIANDGLCDLYECPQTESDTFPGVTIQAFKFTSGKKRGYLAFHRSNADKNWIHIKSFHLDDTNPSLGTIGDLFKEKIEIGAKK